ncbi:hypothetical protein HDK90DRAFT_544811 [Phyllosticta capitalensis]|uniref:Fungal N-terminal domain-containing protein n=1 Tax=Phyllosticta capitalensis TaxID=121624 RepID=A0ABR1YAH9_9PEZI
MDPASIVGLVEFGLSFASAISNVLSDIRGGAEDARKLITEIEFTADVVKQLDRVIDENKHTQGFNDQGLILLQSSRQECEQILGRLRLLVVKSGTKLPPKAKPGEFYKIRAKDIERSIFRTADWVRHKGTFDQVVTDLEGARSRVSIALHTYSIQVARKPSEKERSLKELVELLQFLKDSGRPLEDLIPQPQDTPQQPTRPQPHESPPDPWFTGTRGSETEDTVSQSEQSEPMGTCPASSTSARSRSQSMSGDSKDKTFGTLVIRSIIERSLPHSRVVSYPKTHQGRKIPIVLRDQNNAGGIATTRSFWLDKNESGEWTSRELEYHLHQLLKDLNHRRTVARAVEALQILPQQCKDVISGIFAANENDDVIWTPLLVNLTTRNRESLFARFLKRQPVQTDGISSLIIVMKRSQRPLNFEDGLAKACQEIGCMFYESMKDAREDAKKEDPVDSKNWGNQRDEARLQEFDKLRMSMEINELRRQNEGLMHEVWKETRLKQEMQRIIPAEEWERAKEAAEKRQHENTTESQQGNVRSSEEEIQRIIKGEKPKDNDPVIVNVGGHHHHHHKINSPPYPRIHKSRVEIATLTYFGLPWEYDKSDSDYLIILKEMEDSETEVLFKHSKSLRRPTTLRIEERPSRSRRPPNPIRKRKRGKTEKARKPQTVVEEFAQRAMKAYTGVEDSLFSGNTGEDESDRSEV